MYLLVENRSQVHLGPIDWRPRFIQSEIKSLEVDFIIPLTPPPNGYIKINDTLEIIPVKQYQDPEYNDRFEQLAGPYYTYTGNEATMYYNVIPSQIHDIKGRLKNIAANTRYHKEIRGTTVNISGTNVFISTAREDRTQFNDLLNTIGNSTISWKFELGFININKSIVEQIIQARADHIQAQFDWEANIIQAIDACTTVDELKVIQVDEPVQIGI